MKSRGTALNRIAVIAIYCFLLGAPVAVLYYSLSPSVVIQFPPGGVTLDWYRNFLDQHRLVDGVWNSFVIAGFSTALALLLGVPAALALTRSQLPGRAALAAFFLSPLNLPGLVLAIGILMFLVSVVQPLLPWTLVGSLAPLLGAHLIITLPWVIRAVSASLETTTPDAEEAARGLGATPVQTFFLVTLPMIRPGVVAGGIFAFMVSFGNFALSLFFTGGTVTTLPVAIFEYVDQYQDPTVAAASSVVILVTATMVIGADRLGLLASRTTTERPSAEKERVL